MCAFTSYCTLSSPPFSLPSPLPSLTESSDVLSLMDLANEPIVAMDHAVMYKKLLQFALEHQMGREEFSRVRYITSIPHRPVVIASLYSTLLPFLLCSLPSIPCTHFCVQGILNDGINYVLEEYSRRYLLRTIDFQLSWLECYLEAERKWHSINPAILYPSLLTCSNFTKGVA